MEKCSQNHKVNRVNLISRNQLYKTSKISKVQFQS